MRRATGMRCALLIAATLAGPDPAGADDVNPAAVSLKLCAHADRLHEEARVRILARALELARRATETTPGDADAHFAVFCALGKQLEDEGVGWRSLGDLRRLRSAVDRTLELDPDHFDALIGKATMLLRLPRLFGGDREEATRCLERARRIEPDHPQAAALWRELHGTASVPSLSLREDGARPRQAAVLLDHASVDVVAPDERR